MKPVTRLVAGLLLLAGCVLSAGCGNLSPRTEVSPKLHQDIDNQNGRIDRIEAIQDSIRLSIEKKTQNFGVQLLQGDGGLLLAFGIVAILCVTAYFYRSSNRNEKIVQILVEQIKAQNDAGLEDNVLKAALYTNVEQEVYRHFSAKK